jgi:hypothetical protein
MLPIRSERGQLVASVGSDVTEIRISRRLPGVVVVGIAISALTLMGSLVLVRRRLVLGGPKPG